MPYETGDLLSALVTAPRLERRLLVVAAHPDDETVGAGELLTRASDPWILHTTDGAPKNPRFLPAEAQPRSTDEYRERRAEELRAAMEIAGVEPARLLACGLADQEASFALVRLTAHLRAVIERLAPEVIVTHPYEGGHPDHDATAFAVHAALCALRSAGRKAPPLVEMTSYHARGGGLVTGKFLPSGKGARIVERASELPSRKRRMLDCFVTQRETLASFSSERERFRLAPAYDFNASPTDEALRYELLGWPMTGAAWRALAAEATQALGLGGAPWR
jgi:LmbE family N-acetylglucosaminyl deacetylase